MLGYPLNGLLSSPDAFLSVDPRVADSTEGTLADIGHKGASGLGTSKPNVLPWAYDRHVSLSVHARTNKMGTSLDVTKHNVSLWF